MSLTHERHLWTVLFEKAALVPQLRSIAAKGEPTCFNLVPYGEIRVKARAASAMGDNFMSDTFIVEAEVFNKGGKSKKRTSFVKVLPSNSLLQQAAFQSGIYNREAGAYCRLFEELRKIRGDRPIRLDVPDVYYTHVDTKDSATTCVVLQDLKALGYRMYDKVKGSDYNHARLAVEALANYHALTMAALRQWRRQTSDGEGYNFPDGVEFIKEKSMFDYGLEQMVKEWLAKLSDFTRDELKRQDLYDWLTDDVGAHLPDIIIQDEPTSTHPMICILHGDFWNNNMLFKYEDSSDKPTGIKMIDFQIVRIGHPLIDLLYFLYSGTLFSLREKHLMELLRFYFDTLVSCLALLDIELGCTWEDFFKEMKRRSVLWMMIGSMVMSMVLNKSAVDNWKAHDEKGDNSKNVEVGEVEKGEMGLSSDLEEKMKNVMATQVLSDNPALNQRLLELLLEVKELNKQPE